MAINHFIDPIAWELSLIEEMITISMIYIGKF